MTNFKKLVQQQSDARMAFINEFVRPQDRMRALVALCRIEEVASEVRSGTPSKILPPASNDPPHLLPPHGLHRLVRDPAGGLPYPLPLLLMPLYDHLIAVQAELKAPESKTNSFGGYRYRNCEDILEAAKPLLTERGLTLVVTDEIVLVGSRYYVKATARLIGADNQTIEAHAFAREPEDKKGTDASQLTGAASSYARKYALNGLFLIDDTEDADARDNREPEKPRAIPPATPEQVARIDELLKETGSDRNKLLAFFKVAGPDASTAPAMIETLEKKLSKQLDDATKANS